MDLVDDKMNPLQKQIEEEGKTDYETLLPGWKQWVKEFVIPSVKKRTEEEAKKSAEE